MDEPTKTFDLSPEQQNTALMVEQLLGKRIADRYVDFCHLAAGTVPLRVSSPIAAHALRELESILRQTLKVPMEVEVTPSREDSDRIEKAKAQLQALGYNNDEVQRASEQLQRLTHKTEIEKIVTRLGLAADGDIATAWKSISQVNRQAHGGRALHHSFVVDDAFRAEWQAPFDTVIRALMIALRGRYAAFMRRIDQLVALPDRRGAVTSFSKEIPGALPLLSHFFHKLETPDWLPHLTKLNLLAAPLSQTDERNDDSLLRKWPAAGYLLRMAKSPEPEARALVVDTLRKVSPSTHPDVQEMGMEILAALPPDEAAPLVDLAEVWSTPDARFIIAQGPHDLIQNLAQGGEADAALRATRAIFKVFSENEKLATLHSRHMYEHHLSDAVKAIAPVCMAESVALLADLLDQAVHISGRVQDDPPHDYTYHLSGRISEEGPKHSVIDGLVGESVRASKIAIEVDPNCTRDVVLRIRSHSPKLFTRIAMHVLSLNPTGAPDLAQAYLTDRDLIAGTWCQIEYGELARAWFPFLSAEIQQEILAKVDSVTDRYRDRFKQRFEQDEKRPPTAAEQQTHDKSIVRELLWRWREVLPHDRRKAVEELGDPDAWQQRIYDDERTPLGAPDFSARPIHEIVTFLETWRPATGEKRETATALAQELREAAWQNAALYSSSAPHFAHLPAIYVRHLLEGLTNASKNRKDLDWKGALALIRAIAQTSGQAAPSGMEGDDPDWSWTRKAAIELLGSGLRRGAEGVPFADAGLVHELILELYRGASRQPDTENFEDSYGRSAPLGAQSTSRGAAVDLCVLLIYWLSKDNESEIGKSPREALDNLPNIRAVFETELSDYTSDGRIPRAILGRYLNWFSYFAEPWLVSHMDALFPGDNLSLRDAAWLAHLSADRGPNSDLAPRMRDCYVSEIGRLGTDTSGRDQQHIDDRFSEYLVILYIEAALADDVFEQFWNTAPVHALQHALWFLGVQLEQIPSNMRVRAVSYWDRRLAAAKASATPDRFRQELGSIGQIFVREGIPGEWLMDQVLAVSKVGFAPSDPYSVMNRLVKLSPNFPDRVAEVLAALVKNQHLDRWVYRSHSDGIRTIFRNGLSTGVPATATFVTEAISYLSSMGETGYLDLLPNPH